MLHIIIGTMLGSMFVTSNRGGGENENEYNVGARLLEMGMARLVSYSAERSPYRKELESALETARESQLGIWKFERELKGSHSNENEDEFDMESKEFVEVKISEVVNGNTFYVHRISDLKNLELVSNHMKVYSSPLSVEKEKEEDFKPQRGMICASSYGSPSAWYRAEIVSIASDDKKASVRYIDFGNVEDVPLCNLRPLSQDIARLDPLALRCVLCFVRVPSLDRHYGQDAAMYFGRLVWDRALRMLEMKFDAKTKTRHVILYANDECINEELVSSGYARVLDRKSSASKKIVDLLGRMRLAGEQAHENHLGMYEYGDPHSDDDDDGGGGGDGGAGL